MLENLAAGVKGRPPVVLLILPVDIKREILPGDLLPLFTIFHP